MVTSEVPGLAIALLSPPVTLDIELLQSTGDGLRASVALPDAVGMLAMKARVLTVRSQDRDVEDLRRCLEIAAADDVAPDAFETDTSLRDLRRLLPPEVGAGGRSLAALTRGLRPEAAARRRTRVLALLHEIVGEAGGRR